MQDQGYYGEDQQKMDQSTRNMKHSKAAKPGDQQDDEQDCPNTHLSFSSACEMPVTARRNR